MAAKEILGVGPFRGCLRLLQTPIAPWQTEALQLFAPDVMWAPLPGSGVLGWGAQVGV